MAVSADGKQLYLGFSTSILTLDVSTLAQTDVPYPSGDQAQQVLATASGSVYAVVQNGASFLALVFNPATATFSAQFPLLGFGGLVASASGAQIFDLTSGSSLAVPAAAPSTVISSTALAAAVLTNASGTYDPKDNLVIMPAESNNVEMLDGSTLGLKGLIALPGVGPVTFSNAAYTGYLTYTTFLTATLVQFDPVSEAVTGTLEVPTYTSNVKGYFRQITAVGNLLYAPYQLQNSSGDLKSGPSSSPDIASALAVVDTTAFKLSAVYPIGANSVEGFAVPKGGTAGYLSTDGGLTGELIKMDLATGAKVAGAAMPASGYLLASTDGATLYLYGFDQLYAIDVATLKVTNSSAPVCTGLAATPDGDYLYCSTTSGVDVLATSSLEVVGTIPSTSTDVSPAQPIITTK